MSDDRPKPRQSNDKQGKNRNEATNSRRAPSNQRRQLNEQQSTSRDPQQRSDDTFFTPIATSSDTDEESVPILTSSQKTNLAKLPSLPFYSLSDTETDETTAQKPSVTRKKPPEKEDKARRRQKSSQEESSATEKPHVLFEEAPRDVSSSKLKEDTKSQITVQPDDASTDYEPEADTKSLTTLHPDDSKPSVKQDLSSAKSKFAVDSEPSTSKVSRRGSAEEQPAQADSLPMIPELISLLASEQPFTIVHTASETDTYTRPTDDVDTQSSLEKEKEAETKDAPGKGIPDIGDESVSLDKLSTPPYSQGQERLSSFLTNLKPGDAFVFMVVPPDGGYGWTIVFISFLCQVIVDGIIFHIGQALPYMAKDFGIQQSVAVLIPAFQIGPITSAFINRYSFRPVAITGSILSCVFITIATFSPNVYMMLCFYSVLGGVTLSMVWVSSQLIIGYYFERYRPIANGVSCSGAGIGIMMFSLMSTYLIPIIGWRNNSLVHVGFLIVACLLSIAYFEVPAKRVGVIHRDDSQSDTSEQEFEQNIYRYSQEPASRLTSEDVPGGGRSTKTTAPWRKCWNKVCGCCVQKRQESELELLKKRYVIQTDQIERQDLFYTGPAEFTEHDRETRRELVEGKEMEVIPRDSMDIEKINFALSMQNLRQTKTADDLKEMLEERETITEMKPKQKKRTKSTGFCARYCCTGPKIRKAFRRLFDFRLLRIFEFRILVLSAFLFPMGFNIPFVYSGARAELPRDQKSLITPCIGLSNFLFRVISGFIAFKYKQYTAYLCGSGIIFGGLSVFISSFFGKSIFWYQMFYAFCYGVAPAFFSTLRAIIYVRAVGLENLTNAFGICGLAMGVGVFVGTSLAGAFNQYTGGYTASFIFGGGCIIIAGILMLIIPILSLPKRTKA